jgi:hypothetical protein
LFSVSLVRQSAIIALLFACLFAPLSEVFGSQNCPILGGSSVSQAESCSDCCAQKQCCSVSGQQTSEPSTLPSSIARVSLSADQLFSGSWKLFLFFCPAYSKEDYSGLLVPASGSPSALLAQLCIRLI